LFSANWPFAQCQIHTGAQFEALIVNAPAIFFNDGGKTNFWPLVGGETFFARRTLTAAANEVAIFSQTCFHHLGVSMAAERALHL
jgi:hypothetical protein